MRTIGFWEATGAVARGDYGTGNLAARGRSAFLLGILLAIVPLAAVAGSLNVSSNLCIKGNPDNPTDNEPNHNLIGCVATQSDPSYPGLTTFTSSYDSTQDPNNTYTYGSYYGYTRGYATYGRLGAVADVITINGTPAEYRLSGYASVIHVAPDSAQVTVSFQDTFTIITTAGLHYYQPVMALDGAAISGVDSTDLTVGQARGQLQYCAGIGTGYSDAFGGSCGRTYEVGSGRGAETATTTSFAPIPFYSGDTISFYASLAVDAAATSTEVPGAGAFGPYAGDGDYYGYYQWLYISNDFYTANESAAFGNTASLTGFIVTDSSGQPSPYTFTAGSGTDYFTQSATPEPATWLLILGGVTLFAARRR